MLIHSSFAAGLLSCALFIPFTSFAAEPVVHITKGTADAPIDAGFYDTLEGPFNGSLTAPSLIQLQAKAARIPGSVAVIPAERFKKSHAAGLQDMIKDTPGVYVQQRFGEESRLSIRGSGIGRSYHLRGVTLLQDGVPLNFADGNADFMEIDPETTRALEVYKGANALQYGAASLGGAINILTPTGYTTTSPYELRFTAGDNDTFRAHAAASRVQGAYDGYAAITGVTSSGWREQNAEDTVRLNTNVGYRLNDQAETRFYVTYNNVNLDVPGTLSLEDALYNPKKAPPINILNDYARDIRAVRVANKTSFVYGGQNIDVGVYGNRKELFHPIFQVLDQTSSNLGAYARLNGVTMVADHKNTYTIGTNLMTGHTEALQYVNVNGSRGAKTGDSDQLASQADIYGENQFYLRPDLALVTGAQLMYATRDFTNNNNTAANDRKDYTELNPKFGVIWDIQRNAQLYSNISRSSELPTFSELVQQPVIGFVPLDAQKAWTAEIGTRGQNGRIGWDVATYQSWVRDELLNYSVDPSIPAANFNADKTTHQGIEAGLDLDIGKGWLSTNPKNRLMLRQVYTFNNFKFDSDAQYGDNRIAGVPRHIYHAELRYQSAQGWEIAPNIEWIPQGGFVDHANTLQAPGYTTLGLKASYTIRPGFDVFVDGRNLTDRHFVSDYAAITDASIANTNVFYPGEGRRIFAGVKVAF